MKLREFLTSLDTYPADADVYYDGALPVTLESEVVVWQAGDDAHGQVHPVLRQMEEFDSIEVGFIRDGLDGLRRMGERVLGRPQTPEELWAKYVECLNRTSRPYLPHRTDLKRQVTWEQVESDCQPAAVAESEPAPVLSPLAAASRRRWQERARKSWLDFRNARQEGDEVWYFATEVKPLSAKAGYALVRSGQVVAAVITLIS